MDGLFLEILNRSIAAGWVVLAVVAARFALKKAPRNLICGLWALVGFRLVIGDSLDSIFSLIPSIQTIAPESVYDPAPVIQSGISSIDAVINPMYTASLKTDGLCSANPLQIWLAIGANLWILGMIAMGVYCLISYWRIRKKVAESVETAPGLFLCDRIDTPFILGIIQPKIYLPSGLDHITAESVIAHERSHIRRKDHWCKPLAFVLLTVFWFNPLLWVAYILLCRDIELACDEAVIKTMSVPEKKAYSSALLECSVKRMNIAACPLAFGEVGVKERVKSVLNYKKPAFWVILVAIIVCVVLAVGFLTDPISSDPMICYETLIYVEDGPKSQLIQADSQEIGVLEGIQDSGDYPQSELWGMNLEESYAGCPIYFADSNLYLLDPEGYYHQFVPTDEPVFGTPHTLTSEIQSETVDTCTAFIGEGQRIHIPIEGAELEKLIAILNNVEKKDLNYRLGDPLEQDLTLMISCPEEHMRSRWTVLLHYYENGSVSMVFDSEVAPMYGDNGDRNWYIENDALNAWMEDILTINGQYGNMGATIVNHIQVDTGGGTMSIGIPSDWTYEVNGLTIRFRPNEAKEGWIELTYGISYADLPEGVEQSVVLAPDLTAVMVTPTPSMDGIPLWTSLRFEMLFGNIAATTDNVDSWWREYGQEAMEILSNVSWTEVESTYTPEEFGISLSVDGVSPNGLTLMVHQNGTPVQNLMTGRPFSLQRLNERGFWEYVPTITGDVVNTWSTEGLMINWNGTTALKHDWTWLYGQLPDGHYRMIKSFSSQFQDPVTYFTDPTWYDVTCSVEFDIGTQISTYGYFIPGMAEPLTIRLSSDGTFSMHTSMFSSYACFGTAVQTGDKLVLTTDDSWYTYTFQVDGDTLIYDKDQSSGITYYLDDLRTTKDLTDGTVFRKTVQKPLNEAS